jgi:hypothetical protein
MRSCEKLSSGALRSQHIARAGNCRCLNQVSDAFCANVLARKHTGRTCSTVSVDSHGRSVSFRSAQTATLLEFLVPFTNYFVRRWFCVLLGPKPPLQRHSLLIFAEFQGTKRFLIPCPRLISSRPPSSGEACKYAMVPVTQTNLERFSTYWYAPFCCVCLGCCVAEFGNSEGTYELPCIYNDYV